MSFSLTILGCSSALPTSKRFPTAQVLNVLEQLFLIDCGEGTQIQVRRYKLRLAKLNHIFISHMHGDHFYGLPGLLSTLNLLGKKDELHIFGPRELSGFLDYVCKNLENLQYKLVFHEVSCKTSELIFENKKVRVYSLPLKHRTPTTGYLFKEVEKPSNIFKEAITRYKLNVADIVRIKHGADLTLPDGNVVPNSELTYKPQVARSYAYCSDTLYNEELVPLIKNCSLLYHEATYANDMIDLIAHTCHSTAEQAATLAYKADVGKLVIGHYSARYKTTDKLLAEAQAVFQNTVAAEDGLTIQL